MDITVINAFENKISLTPKETWELHQCIMNNLKSKYMSDKILEVAEALKQGIKDHDELCSRESTLLD